MSSVSPDQGFTRVLGQCGADICSSEESEGEQDSLYSRRLSVRRWNKNWRGKRFLALLEALRGRKQYCGLPKDLVLHGAVDCIPPEGTPIVLIDEGYLWSHGISHVGVR